MSQANEPKVFDGSTLPQSGPRSPKEPLDGETDGLGNTTEGEPVDGESTGFVSVTSGPRSPKEPL